MEEYLGQCILIFNILFIILISSSCMNQVYQEVSDYVDNHYYEKGYPVLWSDTNRDVSN